jgi:hypothetical protein
MWEDEEAEEVMLTVEEFRKKLEEQHRQEMKIYWQRKAKERNERTV